MEALAAGLPLICRQDECLSGVVEDGVNGWQYTDETEFDETVRRLLGMSADERYSLRENALESAQKFSTKAFAEKMEEIYLINKVMKSPQEDSHRSPVQV